MFPFTGVPFWVHVVDPHPFAFHPAAAFDLEDPVSVFCAGLGSGKTSLILEAHWRRTGKSSLQSSSGASKQASKRAAFAAATALLTP